ncbi:MAG: hypothetical protein ABIQ90_03260 [Polaromonas sp.]
MAMKVDRVKSEKAGCKAYVAKPLRYQALYAAIDTISAKAKSIATRSEN